MNTEKKEYVCKFVDNSLMNIFTDALERQTIVEFIIIDVICDIEETADENFNDSDIRIAIARVMYNKLIFPIKDF